MAIDSEEGSPITQSSSHRSPNILVSYQELVKLNARMERIDSKLDVALTLPAKIADQDKRITALETERAVRNAKGGVYGKGMELLWALALTLIAAGVWWPHH